MGAESFDDALVVAIQLRYPNACQALRGTDHRMIGPLTGCLYLTFIEQHLRFEGLPFGGSQGKLNLCNNLAGAFAGSHVAGGEFSGITPVAVKFHILMIGGDVDQIFEHGLYIYLTDAFDKILKRLPVPTVFQITPGYAINNFRDATGRDGAYS